jgi:hypothetical protein
MASDQSATPSAQAGGLTFEVDRFDWAAPDRIEVIGRWYGLRGHRFMRPVLDVSAGDDQRRLLALLEHKPWAAEEGEEWIAAFPWKGEPLDFDDAELALAPSIAVELEPPRAPGGRKRRPAPDAKRTHAAPARPDGRTLDRLERELAAAQEDREQLRAEVALLEGRLAAERDAAERREAHRASREERAAAEERDEAIAERDAARAERDEARQAAVEARERVRALRGRSSAADGEAHERAERAERQRDEATAAHAELAAERDTIAEQERLLEREREQARRARQKAETEAEKADRAESNARAEREAARVARESTRAQATSAAVPPTPRGPRAATALPDVPAGPPGPPAWLARGLALLALIVLVLVLLVLLNGSL